MISRLKRETSNGSYMPEVDGLRGVAILAVVIFHLLGMLSPRGDFQGPILWTLWRGHYGVQLFFSVSGFVLALQLIDRARGVGGPTLRQYLLRRLTRIEPPYLICLLVVFLFHGLWRQPWYSEHFMASVFYAHALWFGSWNPEHPALWSLEVEVQWYLLAPLVVLSLWSLRSDLIRGVVLCMAICALVAAQRLVGVGREHAIGQEHLSVLWWIQHFLVGVLMALLRRSAWRDPSRSPWPWDVVGAAGWLLIVAALNTESSLAFVGTAMAFAGALRGQVLRAALSWAPLAVTGGMCYTIYLYHMLVLDAFAGPLRSVCLNAGLPVGVLAYLALTAAFCVPAYLLFERPFMDGTLHRRLEARLFSSRVTT